MPSKRFTVLTKPAFCLLLLLLSVLKPFSAIAQEYVGAQTCGSCHQQQLADWTGSHHQMAMGAIDSDLRLGDFENQSFHLEGITATFSRENDRYFVETRNSEGVQEKFEVTHTFGYEPLQQYLVSFDDGRKQALQIAWDSRPATEGGQRWFHLYENDIPAAGEALDWTGFTHNWNTSCAYCHVTDLDKNYDLQSNRFDTRFSEMNIACEACHGAGSDHLTWVASENRSAPYAGFPWSMQSSGLWSFAEGAVTAHAVAPENRAAQEVCAQCHSLRTELSSFHGSYHDSFIMAPVSEPEYYLDGQQKEEVFVSGSFWQSRMYEAGVTCSNCHNPHSLELVVAGNQVCTQCHLSTTFDTPSHHFHQTGSDGASCANCHMPETLYMVVDARRDHNIRVPRPDLSASTGAPNSCNQCHQDESIEWAAAAFENWWPSSDRHYSNLIVDSRSAAPNASTRLLASVSNPATLPSQRVQLAAELAANHPDLAVPVMRRLIRSEHPLEQLGGMHNLRLLAPDPGSISTLFSLLDSAPTSLAYLATRELSRFQANALTTAQTARLQQAVDQQMQLLKQQSDNPGLMLELAVMQMDRGEGDAAMASIEQALQIAPNWEPALLSLAQAHTNRGDEAVAQAVYRQILESNPSSANTHFALALSHVRSGERATGIEHLEAAYRLQPMASQFGYVLAVALRESGNTEDAIAILKEAWEVSPTDARLGVSLVLFQREVGNHAEAQSTLQLLTARSPRDAQVQQLNR